MKKLVFVVLGIIMFLSLNAKSSTICYSRKDSIRNPYEVHEFTWDLDSMRLVARNDFDNVMFNGWIELPSNVKAVLYMALYNSPDLNSSDLQLYGWTCMYKANIVNLCYGNRDINKTVYYKQKNKTPLLNWAWELTKLGYNKGVCSFDDTVYLCHNISYSRASYVYFCYMDFEAKKISSEFFLPVYYLPEYMDNDLYWFLLLRPIVGKKSK